MAQARVYNRGAVLLSLLLLLPLLQLVTLPLLSSSLASSVSNNVFQYFASPSNAIQRQSVFDFSFQVFQCTAIHLTFLIFQQCLHLTFQILKFN